MYLKALIKALIVCTEEHPYTNEEESTGWSDIMYIIIIIVDSLNWPWFQGLRKAVTFIFTKQPSGTSHTFISPAASYQRWSHNTIMRTLMKFLKSFYNVSSAKAQFSDSLVNEDTYNKNRVVIQNMIKSLQHMGMLWIGAGWLEKTFFPLVRLWMPTGCR